jgi:amino acid adenylation domain-containing protein
VRVGVPTSNRHRRELEGLVGFFANTLVLRQVVAPSARLREHLAGVRRTVVEAQENQDLPFEQLVDALAPDDRASQDALFQVMFSWHREVDATQRVDASLSLERRPPASYPAKFDLTLHVTDTGHGLRGEFVYPKQLFRRETLALWARRLEVLLDAMLARPHSTLAELEWLPAEERERTLGWARPARVDYPPRAAHAGIDEAAARDGAALAVRAGDRTLSYAELAERAGRVARALIARGIGPERRVALCLPRSLELVVALYGVLRCGAAYVPLDPKQPEARLADTVADSGAALVLGAVGTPALGVPVLEVEALELEAEADAVREAAGPGSGAASPLELAPQSAAYVIYTSGSTGRPKGVVVTHRALDNYVRGLLDRLDLPAGVSMGMVSTVAADLGNTVLFGALCSGRPLHLLSEELVFDPDALGAYMQEHSVGVLKIVPSHLSGLLAAQHPEHVLPKHTLVVGGEASSWELVERIERLGVCQIMNHYGPTETTVGVLTHRHRGERLGAARLPLGRPLPNSRVYVLGPDLTPMPRGVPGEIFIAGDGVARGYWQQPGLSAERFVPDPFGAPGDRMYRTGDRARYVDDGAIEFLGRGDEQVKIRGYRIELGEIRAELLRTGSVADAELVVRDAATSSPRLIAYAIAHAGRPVPSSAELRSSLAARLPDYMLPSDVVWLEKFPVTANGKLDRRALPEPGAVAVAPGGVLATDAERTLAGIWRDVLKVEQVGALDNFFMLGGDSILILQVVARARRAGLAITPKQLIAHQTLRDAAAAAKPHGLAPVAKAASPSGELGLTPVQAWFFSLPFADKHHFNQSVLLETREALDPALLERAFAALYAQHDAFRLRYREAAHGWTQY